MLSKSEDPAIALDRSFTDPITNATLMSQGDLARHLDEMVSGQLPIDFLPSFLHEATHHWCFFGSVGAALSLIHRRARRQALMAAARDMDADEAEDLKWKVFDDFIRYDSAMILLRPLVEGIALFMEFDVVPGDSSISSDLLTLVQMLFRSPTEAGGRKSPLSDDRARELLFHARTSELIERKAHLLLSPLGLDAGGYLIGYLMVKNYWLSLAVKHERLWDRDLFAMYFIEYIFNDLGLVANILDPEHRDVFAVEALTNYLAGRLTGLQGLDPNKFLDELEKVRDQPYVRTADEVPATPDLATGEALRKVGLSRLTGLWSELREDSESTDDYVKMLARYDLWSFAQRQIMCIGRMAVQVRMVGTSHVLISVDARPVCILSGLPDVKIEGETSGSLDVFVHPYPGGRFLAVTVSVDDTVVSTYFSRDPGENVRRDFTRYRTDTAAVSEGEQVLKEYLIATVTEDESMGHVLAAERDILADWTTTNYSKFGLKFVRGRDRAQVFRTMQESGFYPVVHRVALVRALAVLGITSAFGSMSQVEQWFAELRKIHRIQPTFEEAVSQIQLNALEALGDRLVFDDRDSDSLLCGV